MRSLAIPAVMWFTVGSVVFSSQRASNPSTLIVGENVHVSAGYRPFLSEVVVDAHPRDAAKLLGCAMVYAPEENRHWTAVFRSTDGGQHWRVVLETREFDRSVDPTCGFGEDGLAFHAVLASAARPPGRWLVAYRSMDDGATWAKQSQMSIDDAGLDREWITVDSTRSPWRGRVYLHGATWQSANDGTRATALGLWSAEKDSTEFRGPIVRLADRPTYLTNSGNAVVGRDGVLVMPFELIRSYARFADPTTTKVSASPPGEAPALLQVITSSDGGRTMSPARTVAEWHTPPEARAGFSIPMAAVDRSGGPYSGRIYLVFPNERDGVGRVTITHSDNNGLMWSEPRVVSDVPRGSPGDETIPVVAVNVDGVVGVSWYDHRNDADNLGYDFYFAASIDGGATFPLQTKVSSASSRFAAETRVSTRAFAAPEADGSTVVQVLAQSRELFAGDTAGLAAAADGAFHPFWVDNRTGSAQVWTASVRLSRMRVESAGQAPQTQDISRLVATEVIASNVEPSERRVSMTIRLRNTSQQILCGPLEFQVSDVRTELADRAVLMIRTGPVGDDARVRFETVGGDRALAPGDVSQTRTLVFRLEGLKPFRQNDVVRFTYVRIAARTVGNAVQDTSACR